MSTAPESPVPSPGSAGTACHACHAPLAADQRYCLECGARRGAGGPLDFAALLGSRAPLALPPATLWSAMPAARAPVAATMLVALLLTGIGLGSLGSPDARGGAARPIAIAYGPPAATSAAPAPVPAPIVPIVPAPAALAPPPPIAQQVTPVPSDGAPAADANTQTEDDTTSDPAPGESQLPPIKHVVVIMLAGQSQPSAFAADGGAPYLSRTLVPDGTLLPDLHTVSASGLANSIALLSGQGPNPQTVAGCPTYADVTPGTIGKDDQAEGEGCVYSVQTATIPNQLERAGLTWRAYLEDQGNGGTGVAQACRRPELGAADPWREPRPGDAYATARNPFVYFHAITDEKSCADNVVDLDKLDDDLALASDKAPALSYIAPNLCNDGRATPCAEGAPAGAAAADAFLSAIVPKIRASKAYEDSLLIVTFDSPAPAPQIASGPADYPTPATTADRGGKVGALLLSPFVRKGRTVRGKRDTYALQATIGRVLGLDPLANGARKGAKPYGPNLFENDAR